MNTQYAKKVQRSASGVCPALIASKSLVSRPGEKIIVNSSESFAALRISESTRICIDEEKCDHESTMIVNGSVICVKTELSKFLLFQVNAVNHALMDPAAAFMARPERQVIRNSSNLVHTSKSLSLFFLWLYGQVNVTVAKKSGIICLPIFTLFFYK